MMIAVVWLAGFPVMQPLASFGQDRTSMFAAGRDDTNFGASPRRPLTEEEMIEQRRLEIAQEIDGETSLDKGESINPDLMDTVKDNTVGVRFQERMAYLRVLRLAIDEPLRRLERYAAKLRWERRETTRSYQKRKVEDFPQFTDLFTRPDVYRGKPVTIHGVMRKLTKFDLGSNKLNLDHAYEGWVYTPDSQGNPIVVVFTSKDERLPVNGDIQEEVRFTGYFFKMYAYEAHDTARRAPLILAGEVECLPHPYKAVYHQIGIEWYGLATLVFLIGWYLIWQMNRREMPPRPLPQVEPDFNHFPPLEHPAPDPFLPHSIVETEDS
jgi:hypothetical protein